eukprot:5082807-Alexandrium_andersonii.AAC.1
MPATISHWRACEPGTCNLASSARNFSEFHPARSRPVDSVPFCAMNPTVTTKQAGGCAGGASRR